MKEYKEIKYYIENNELDLEKIIDEVIVGPRSQQNINILRQYIYSNGLYDLADRITMSECPLR